MPRAGQWWPAAHPNSHPLGRHPVFGGLVSWWGMWQSGHPATDPSTELGGGEGLGSRRLGAFSHAAILGLAHDQHLCFKNNVERFLVSSGAFTSHSSRAGLKEGILE